MKLIRMQPIKAKASILPAVYKRPSHNHGKDHRRNIFTTESSTVTVLFDSLLLSSALCPDHLSQSTMSVLPEAQGFLLRLFLWFTQLTGK